MEHKFADKFKIESNRRLGWNYSSLGIYFITICTLNHNNFLGKINDGKIEYQKAGEIVNRELNKTLEIRKYLKLFAGVVMPNHIHLLLAIRNQQVETPGLASRSSLDFIQKTEPEFQSLGLKNNKIINQNYMVETPGLASLPGDPRQIPVISNYKKHPDFFKNNS